MVLLTTLDVFVDLSAVVFPRLWNYLCTLKNLVGDRHRHNEEKTLFQGKKSSCCSKAPSLEKDEQFPQSQVVGPY
jgi:hypothetical protein